MASRPRRGTAERRIVAAAVSGVMKQAGRALVR